MNSIRKPRKFHDGTVANPSQALTMVVDVSANEPISLTTASKHLHWREAMNSEFNALLYSGTWTLVPKLPTMNLVGASGFIRSREIWMGLFHGTKPVLWPKGFINKPRLIIVIRSAQWSNLPLLELFFPLPWPLIGVSNN